MATYPKIIRPPRMYPTANAIMAIRAHVQQVSPNPALGQFSLVAGVARHIGTIPKGSFVMPAAKHVVVAFNGTTPAIDVGSQAVAGLFIPTASIAPAAIAFASGLNGAGAGFVAADTPVYILLSSGAGNNVGELDLILPFYTNRD